MHAIHNWHRQHQLWLHHLKPLTFMGAHPKSQARSMMLTTIWLSLLVMQMHQNRHHLRRQLPNSGKVDQVWWIQTFVDPTSWPYFTCCAWHINIDCCNSCGFISSKYFSVHEVKDLMMHWYFKAVLCDHWNITILLDLMQSIACEWCLFRHINNCRSIVQHNLGHSRA